MQSAERQSGDRMTNLGELRRQRHAHWMAELKQSLNTLVAAQRGIRAETDQIYPFGYRARGDWDGLSEASKPSSTITSLRPCLC